MGKTGSCEDPNCKYAHRHSDVRRINLVKVGRGPKVSQKSTLRSENNFDAESNTSNSISARSVSEFSVGSGSYLHDASSVKSYTGDNSTLSLEIVHAHSEPIYTGASGEDSATLCAATLCVKNT